MLPAGRVNNNFQAAREGVRKPFCRLPTYAPRPVPGAQMLRGPELLSGGAAGRYATAAPVRTSSSSAQRA